MSLVPWTTLGNPIDHDSEPEQMLITSNLNWTVSKRPMFCPEIPDLTLDEFRDIEGGGSFLNVPDNFALVRDTDRRVLGICGPDYIPTQNEKAFRFFKRFTDAGKMRMETAGSLQGGKQVWVLAKLAFNFTLPGGDEVRGYLLLSSPHIWGKSLVIKFVTIRVVCMNTFTMAMNESTYGKGFRMPHIRDFDGVAIKEAEVTLGIADELFKGFQESACKLSQSKVDMNIVTRYIADIFQPELITDKFGKGFYKKSPHDQAEMLVHPDGPVLEHRDLKRIGYDVYNCVKGQPGGELASANGTMWGAFNAITYFADYRAGRDRDNALYSAWFGPRSVTKSKALKRAVQIAEVMSQ